MAKPKRKPKPKKTAAKPGSDAIAWVKARERASNELGLDSRDLYKSHRDRLTSLIASFSGTQPSAVAVAPSAKKRLCLLGAGNCNDVDLAVLAELFAEVHLVDIDDAAVLGAISRQPEHLRSKLFAHVPMDLSGLFAGLPGIKQLDAQGLAQPNVFAVELLKLVHTSSAELVARLPGPFDVCVSCCLSTQLSWALTELLGKTHARLETLRLSLLMIHLRVLTGLRTPGTGVSLWVTDVSSSSLYPVEEALKVVTPRALVGQLVASGKVYSGGSPKMIERILSTDPSLGDTSALETYEPWLWYTRARTYLVQALRFGERPRATPRESSG